MIAPIIFSLLLAAELPTGPGPYHLAGGDLNGDGFPDVVAACRGELLLPTEKRPANDTVTLYLTSGSAKLAQRRELPVGFGPYTSVVADMDEDKRLDIAVANFHANDGRELALLWGNSADPFLDPATFLKIDGRHAYDKQRTPTGEPIYPTPGLTSIAAADVNRDGKLDLIAVAWSSDFFVVLLNQGKRRFSERMFPLPPGPRDVATGDFNGDGNVDAAFSIYSSNLVEVWHGDGKGAFTRSQTFHAQGHIPYHLKSADIDADGKPDLIVGNRGPSDNVTLFWNRAGRFEFAGSFQTGTAGKGESTADEIRDVLAHDFDGDGKLDLLAAGHVSHKVIVWSGTGRTEFGKAFGPPRPIAFPAQGPRALLPVGSRVAVALFDSNQIGWLP